MLRDDLLQLICTIICLLKALKITKFLEFEKCRHRIFDLLQNLEILFDNYGFVYNVIDYKSDWN